MSDETRVLPCIVPAPGGEVICAFGDEITMHLSGAETGGRYCMFTVAVPPGGGPPPHRHMKEDEWWYVLEGQASFLKDGGWVEVGTGGAVFMPRGTVHTFRNTGQGALRMLVHTSPAGFDVFFRKCAAEFAKPGVPDMAKLTAIAAEHGMQFA